MNVSNTARPFVPSQAQQAFFDWVVASKGNCILEAVAGAGKTTTILEGINRMKGRVWFGVYNKKMADEIVEKVKARPELRNRPFPAEALFTKTFHGEGFALLLQAAGKGAKINVDDKKVARIVDGLIAEREGVAQERRDDLRALAGTILAIVSMAKNRGFVAPTCRHLSKGLTDWSSDDAWWDMITHFDLDAALPEDADRSTVLAFARAALKRSNADRETIDFDDMVYQPLALNLEARFPYDWVLVDEAQDTNPTRRALAEMIMRRGARLVAVGDPHQAIYGFTGADNDSLEQIARRFKATKLPLTVTYRCPKAVVAHAQQWVSHITAHASSPEGQVLVQPYQDVLATMTSIPRDAYGETAFLCRYNKYLVGLCFKMIRLGMPAKIEGREIGTGLIKLATRWKSCKTVNGLETKLRDYMNKEVTKALAAGHEDKADRITDQVETLLVMIERAREQKLDRVTDLEAMIAEMFQDNVAGKGLITLCSAHKSKGLEWDTVYLLGREGLMPSKFAKQAWQVDQEVNLIYVAVTRAKATLIEVTGVVEEKKEGSK